MLATGLLSKQDLVFLSVETRYSMIELECTGCAWAMNKCRQFIEGLTNFDLYTDHQALIPILNDYALDKLDNPRLLRLRLKMMRFVFTAKWVPGKKIWRQMLCHVPHLTRQLKKTSWERDHKRFPLVSLSSPQCQHRQPRPSTSFSAKCRSQRPRTLS